ncbi:MAG TPA: DUF1573 domain-containing protein [Isosphaeraceae bacterium]|nr:DUF1573 domain-containing protein [Isosphaeraceae bacterium]
MLRWVILCVVVVVLAAAATLVVQYGSVSSPTWSLPAGVRKEGPQPRVEVEGALTHEFGELSTQRTTTRKWKVKNTGAGDLEIWLLGSTCTCTIPKLKGEGTREVVKPGESTEIELEWKTKDAIGEFSKGATIGTNDPDRPEFMLRVHGMVHSPIVVLPAPHEGVLMVGDISNDKVKEMSLAVYSPEHPELNIKKISTSMPNLIVARPVPFTPKDLENLEAKGGYRVNLEFKPGMALGTFREELIVETDHPEQPKLQLLLAGTASGPISLLPSILRMVVNGKDGASGQMTLLVREGRQTSFRVIRKPEKVEVSIAPNDTPTRKGQYRLTLTVPPGTSPGLIDDEIIFQTDHPNASELKVPVNIVVGSG